MEELEKTNRNVLLNHIWNIETESMKCYITVLFQGIENYQKNRDNNNVASIDTLEESLCSTFKLIVTSYMKGLLHYLSLNSQISEKNNTFIHFKLF